MANITLADLIKKGEITLRGQNGALETHLNDFGPYNRTLAEHINAQSDVVIVAGDGLATYLSNQTNVYELGAFLMQLFLQSRCKGKYHVDVDLDEVNRLYSQDSVTLTNLSGTETLSSAQWMPHMNQFERSYNLILCRLDCELDPMGYVGPYDSPSFERYVVSHAVSFMIGRGEQLDRYLSYAAPFKEYRKRITEGVKMFKCEGGHNP